MKRLALLFCLAALTVPALGAQDPAATPPPARRRVAVLDFDYATVHSHVADIWGSDVDIGKGIATMLLNELVRNGTYVVIERTQIDRIMSEQNFQQSGRADASTAAQLGRLLGVDAIIVGSITQFGRDDKKLGVGGGAIKIGGIGLGGLGRRSSKAAVVIDARIVQIGTAEIIGVAQGRGESKRSGITLAAALPVGGGVAGGVLDMSSSNFASTILGEATRDAVANLVVELVAAAARIPETVVSVAALVADVSGSELIINVGTAAGLRVGAEYNVLRPGREINDPTTGQLLRRMTTPVGKVKITSAEENSAVGTLTGGPAQVKDCVGSCPLPPAAAPLAPPSGASPPAGSQALSSDPATGPATWTAYSLKGTEHFRYDVSMTMGNETQTGFYLLDASPGEAGKIRMRVQGQLGKDAFSSTIMLSPNAPPPVEQLTQLGSMGMILLLAPVSGGTLAGHSWTVGEKWSTNYGGHVQSYTVESTCQFAGLQGIRAVVRQDNQMLMEMCISPSVGFPLAVTMNGAATGVAGYGYAFKLTQFRM